MKYKYFQSITNKAYMLEQKKLIQALYKITVVITL